LGMIFLDGFGRGGFMSGFGLLTESFIFISGVDKI
jgi:hypothetical protein